MAYSLGTSYTSALGGYTRFPVLHPGINIMGYNMTRHEGGGAVVSPYYKSGATGVGFEICRPGYGSVKFKVTGAVNVYPLCFTYSDKSTDIKVYINGEYKTSCSQVVGSMGSTKVAFCMIEGLDPTKTYTIELKTLASNTGNWNLQGIDMCGGIVDDVAYTPSIIYKSGATTAVGSYGYLTTDPGWTRYDSSVLNMYSYSGAYAVEVNTNYPGYFNSSFRRCRDGAVTVAFTGASTIRYCGAEFTTTVSDFMVYLNGEEVSVVNLIGNSTNCGSSTYRASVIHEIVDLDPTKTYIVTYKSANTSSSYTVNLDSIDLYGDAPQLLSFTPGSIFIGTVDNKLCQYDASATNKIKNVLDYSLTNLQSVLFEYDNATLYGMVSDFLELDDSIKPSFYSLLGSINIETIINSVVNDVLLNDNQDVLSSKLKSIAHGESVDIVPGDVAYGTGIKQEFIVPTSVGKSATLVEVPELVGNNVNILARPNLIYSDNIGYSELQINVTPKNDGMHCVATDYFEIYTVYTKDSPFFAPEVSASEDGSPMRRINVNLNNFFEIVFKEPYDTIVTPDWMTVMDGNKRVNGMPTISGTYYLICTKDGIPTKLEIVVNALTRMA